MINTSKERTKKYRENKKLKELNQQIKERDVLRGEKLTSKYEGVILRENLKLNGNEPKTRFKIFISKLIRHYYNNDENCFFFTLCYPFSEKKGYVENASILQKIRDELIFSGAVESMIIIPEYHKTRSAIHNHGIIRVAKTFTGNIESEFKRLWIDAYNGSIFVTSLDASKLFEEYLTKFVKADKSRLYNFCDGLLTEGIDFNAVPELKVTKPKLIPIKLALVGNIETQPNITLLREQEVSITDSLEFVVPISNIDLVRAATNLTVVENITNDKKISFSNPIQKILIKFYGWYSLLFVMYSNFILKNYC